ncbi:5245_t:CDS:2, partial [Gigaspora margarita]
FRALRREIKKCSNPNGSNEPMNERKENERKHVKKEQGLLDKATNRRMGDCENEIKNFVETLERALLRISTNYKKKLSIIRNFGTSDS